LAAKIAASCRAVDPQSTDEVVSEASADLETPTIAPPGATGAR